jgi:hypothetical protein
MAHIIVRVTVEYEGGGSPNLVTMESMEFPVRMVRHIQYGPMVGLVIERILEMARRAGRSQDE